MSYIINADFFKQNTKFYVYLHLTKDGMPFYIGKGKGNRCLHTHSRSFWWNNVVSKYGYYIKILEINLDEDKCLEREIYWIEFFGRKQLGKGTLVNMTNGGDGASGRIYSKKEKEIRSQFFKNNLKTLQEIGNRINFFGLKLTGEENPNYGNTGSNNPMAKAVIKLDLRGNFIKEYGSLIDAEIANKVKGVYQVCKRYRHQVRGFIYLYKEDYENGNYTITTGITSKKVVYKLDKETGTVLKKYNSINETEKDGFNPKNVSQVCSGEKITHKGYKWKKE